MADAGSYTRAAEQLFVGQPALSIAVRQLEAAIGVRLFERNGRGVRPTPAGEALQRSSELVLASVERAVVRAREADRDEVPVRLCMPYEGNDTGRRVLREVRAAHEDVRIERLHLGSRAALRALMAGEADAIVGGAFSLPAGLRHERLRDEPLVVVMPSGHAMADRSSVLLAELARETFYLPSERTSATWYWFVVDQFRRAGLEPQLLEGADGGGPVVFGDLVAEERCLAIAVASDAFGPGVRAVPVADRDVVYPWSLIWHGDDPSPQTGVILAAARRARAVNGWRVGAGHSQLA